MNSDVSPSDRSSRWIMWQDRVRQPGVMAAFGAFDAWETEFRRIGQGLGGGSGWVVLGFNTRLKLLENYWMADHSTHPADTGPLLVMEMYDYAYQTDYGPAAPKYIDAFFANNPWEAVAKRL